ncbi:uncharacterized protein BCR38DRAFT_335635 [Pseudomassariella vexata]|uniref:DUF7719 domain-containing protein n=1 Tax=Pseudomassariella vexata TaxID=1141098 RepID=A0A1Y2EAD7_9PEZI|nr:uncharacterized protein BCR38DRAFT_335635 [Pseudomassariella vexata]ORY68533.1 hypothetical protein BCR38DRAFT_335635 [Pseudomassariella vexata]
MVNTRKERKAANIKLKQPDRSGPSDKTLLELAQERSLFDMADARQRKLKKDAQLKTKQQGEDIDKEIGPETTVDRVMETILWSVSLAMMHFTLDVLVQHQYATDLSWPTVCTRGARALAVFLPLFYVLHPHASSPTLLPGLPGRFQDPLRQSIFFMTSVCSGCYLIHISNTYAYLAVMKQSPPLGCLWVWSVVELNLIPAMASFACAVAFMWFGGYTFK